LLKDHRVYLSVTLSRHHSAARMPIGDNYNHHDALSMAGDLNCLTCDCSTYSLSSALHRYATHSSDLARPLLRCTCKIEHSSKSETKAL